MVVLGDEAPAFKAQSTHGDIDFHQVAEVPFLIKLKKIAPMSALGVAAAWDCTVGLSMPLEP